MGTDEMICLSCNWRKATETIQPSKLDAELFPNHPRGKPSEVCRRCFLVHHLVEWEMEINFCDSSYIRDCLWGSGFKGYGELDMQELEQLYAEITEEEEEP